MLAFVLGARYPGGTAPVQIFCGLLTEGASPSSCFPSLFSPLPLFKATLQSNTHYPQTHVGLGQVAVQGGRVELGQAVHLVDVGVEAIADGNVDQAVVGTQWHGGLGALLGQGVEPGASPSSQDDAQHRLCGKAGQEGETAKLM